MTIKERFGGFSVRAGSSPRTAGIHLSGVLRYMALESGVLKPEDEEEDLDLLLAKYPDWQTGNKKAFNRIALGLAWEEWYSRQQGPDFVYHPGEYVLDGIVGTPDGVRVLDTGDLEVNEFKLTWRSSKRPIEDAWLYWSQLKGYCRMAGEGVLRGMLHVYYVNGDYTGSGPILKSYPAQFDQREVNQLWMSILKHKGRARPEPGQGRG